LVIIWDVDFMFNNRLREVRMLKGLTQEKLSEIVGVGLRNYQYYEQGKHVPSFEVLIKLADVLNVSIDYLVGRDDFIQSQDDVSLPEY